MKIGITSDVHCEFRGSEFPDLEERVDVLILAGDIGVGVDGAKRALDKYFGLARKIVYVAGNHEYYSKDIFDVNEGLSMLSGMNDRFYFLERGSVTLGGVRFIGATGWTDFELYGTPAISMGHAVRGLNDYHVIKRSGKIITPEQTRHISIGSREFIKDELEEIYRFGGKSVVITHHAPSIRSVNPKYRNDELNPCYANNWDDLLDKSDIYRPVPKFWFHGHMHDPVDYMIGGTRVLSNPCGYPHERSGRPKVKVVEYE